MNPKNTEKLVKAFPDFFRDIHGDPLTTAMCWGIETGDGWFNILWQLCEDIQKTNPENLYFTQIKEKYGSLRVYCGPASNKVYELIDKAERKSCETCEECGSMEDVDQRGNGWIRTLCAVCLEKE